MGALLLLVETSNPHSIQPPPPPDPPESGFAPRRIGGQVGSTTDAWDQHRGNLPSDAQAPGDGFFGGLPGLCHAMLKEVRKKNWPESLGELRFTLGVFTYHLVFCCFFQFVGVNSLGGRNLAISGVAMKLTPQEKWKILPIVEQLGEPPTIGIRQLKGDSTLSGWTAIHNHQTSTKRKFWKDQTSNVLKSQFPSKYACYNTLPWLTGVFEEVSWTLEFSLDIWKTHSLTLQKTSPKTTSGNSRTFTLHRLLFIFTLVLKNTKKNGIDKDLFLLKKRQTES